MYRSIPLLLLALADLGLALRWLWIGARVIARADGMGDSMIGAAIFVAGIATAGAAALLLVVARRASAISLYTYVPLLVLFLMIGGLPWLAFATIP